MSKVGRKPIEIPKGVTVQVADNMIKVKGPKGELSQSYEGDIQIEIKENAVLLERGDDQPQNRAYHGLYRSLINNMVIGTSQGFTRVLELIGTGYRAQMKGKVLSLSLGFSHPVEVEIPSYLECKLEGQTKIFLTGINKQQVGQFASDIRDIRPPEPYKGKGIRYEGEVVRRKAGKSAK